MGSGWLALAVGDYKDERVTDLERENDVMIGRYESSDRRICVIF